MKSLFPSVSVISAIISVMLLVVPTFKTPPLAITIFALIGIVMGIAGLKVNQTTATMGILISTFSFLYLVYLFIQLGG